MKHLNFLTSDQKVGGSSPPGRTLNKALYRSELLWYGAFYLWGFW